MCFLVYKYKSQCFQEFSDYIVIGSRIGQPWFKSDGIKEENIRIDNLFFKRVTDIIINP